MKWILLRCFCYGTNKHICNNINLRDDDDVEAAANPLILCHFISGNILILLFLLIFVSRTRIYIYKIIVSSILYSQSFSIKFFHIHILYADIYTRMRARQLEIVCAHKGHIFAYWRLLYILWTDAQLSTKEYIRYREYGVNE